MWIRAQPLPLPRFAVLGVEEGLSRGAVTDLFQDKRGYFWIGTTDGLNRYDGEEVKVYRTDNNLGQRSQSANRVQRHLCEDESGNIWYANETGVYCCNPVRMRVEKYPFPVEFTPGTDIQGVMTDPNTKSFWLFDRKNGIVRVQYADKPLKTAIFPFPAALENEPVALQANDRQQILIPTGTDSGLWVFDTKTQQFESFFKGINITAAFFQPGLYYFLTPGAIIRAYTLQRAAETWAVPQGVAVQKIVEDPAGRVWAGTAQNGLWYYERHRQKWTKCTAADRSVRVLPPNTLTNIYLDHTANLWIGSQNEGVCRLDTKHARFNMFPSETRYADQLKDRWILSICEDNDQNVWFSVKSGGLYCWNPENGRMKYYPAGTLNALFLDREDRLWAGSSKGLSFFDLKNEKWHGVDLKMPQLTSDQNFQVHKIVQTRQGQLLAATRQGIFTIHTTAKNQWVAASAQGIPVADFKDLTETQNGDLWAICAQTGLCQYQPLPDGTFRESGHYLDNFELSGLHTDQRDANLIWVASAEGLLQFNTEKADYKIFSQADGLPYRAPYNITEDARNNLWMSAEGGICRMEYNNNRHIFYQYNASDGLLQTEFNTGVVHRGPSGTIYFGGPRGFTYFAPEDSLPNHPKPFLAIDQIFVNERLVSADSGKANIPVLRLSTTENDLNFRFAALDFTRPAANKIQYTLEGRDETWFTTARERMVRYTNLPPGLYTLRVKAGNGQGVWSEEKQLKVFIDAPFWRRSNILILAWISLWGLAFWWFSAQNTKKYREQLAALEKQRAVEAERNRIAKDMHDEIGSGLSQIALMTELLNTGSISQDRSKNYARDIGTNARKLVQSISEIIWALNPQQDSLDSLLSYIREQTYSFFEPFESVIQYQIFFPETVPHHVLGNQQRRNLYLVAKEALNNALKHGKANNISLTLDYQPHQLHFRVQDDGQGIDPTQKSTGGGFGLPNMRRRMEEIGGGIQWKSEKGTGTVVDFWMPL